MRTGGLAGLFVMCLNVSGSDWQRAMGNDSSDDDAERAKSECIKEERGKGKRAGLRMEHVLSE